MKVLVLNSGGKETLATMMILSKTSGYDLHSLYVDIGQENTVNAQIAAKKLADKYCKAHSVVHVDGNFMMTNQDGFKHVTHQGSLLHTLAASYAVSNGIYAVASGQQESGIGADFFQKLDAMLRTAKLTKHVPTFIYPMMSIGDVYDIIKDEPLWHETVTCNREPPCGKCGKCIARAEWEGR